MARRSIDSVLAERRAEDPVGFQRIAFLNGVRRALKWLRGDLVQTEIARRSGRGQSEISRLESAVTEHTQIGTLIAYAQACGGSLVIGLRDKNGALVSLDSKMTSEQVDAAATPQPTVVRKEVAGVPAVARVPAVAEEWLHARGKISNREAVILALLAKTELAEKYTVVMKSPTTKTYYARLSKAMAIIEDPKAKTDLQGVQMHLAKLAKRFANMGDVVGVKKVR